MNQLPTIAKSFLVNKSLKDEIALSNGIEGISSTKKEIDEAVFNQNSEKKARFKGLAAKYIKLIEDDEILLNTCEDVRRIYDDIVADEIAIKINQMVKFLEKTAFMLFLQRKGKNIEG